MEKENNKKEGHMLSGFFDRCKEMYTEGSQGEIGLNPLEELEDKKPSRGRLSAEEKLKKIKRIILD